MGGYRRFCVQCGGELKQGARFCPNCGRLAANSPQPAVTGEHDLGRDLQAPPPSPAWDATAAPPDGALFPPPGSGYPPQDAPFPLEGSGLVSEGSRVLPEGHGYRREGQGLPPGGPPFPPEGHGFPPEGPLFPRDDTAADLPFPRDDPPFPQGAAADGPLFPRDGIAATQTRPASPSTGLALPSAYPAAAAALPAASAFSGPPTAARSAYPAPADTAQFSQNWMNDVGFSPQWEPSPPSAGDVEEADRDRPRPRRLLLAGLIALVAAVIVVPALLIAHSLHGITGGGSAAAQPTAKQPTRAATATAPSRRTAAAGLATLLAQTAADRSSIVNAVGAVEGCTPTLGQVPQVFQTAAASRQRLLQQLAGLPGRSALPTPMLQELTGAWQASAAVDQDLGRWAQDEVARGCKPGDHADANFQASGVPDVQATNDKTAFVAMWNAIAAKYGLTRYRTSQL